MHSIKKNIILNCIRTFVSVFFPFILFQYASRIIQVENLGKVNFSNSVINYFILIAGLGINSYAIRESGKIIKEKKRMELFASEVFSINIISAIISLVLLILTIHISDKLHNYLLLLVIQSTTIISTTFSLEWINVVYEDYSYITIRTIVFQLLTFLLTVMFVKSVDDYVMFAIIVAIGKVGPDVMNWVYIRNKYLKVVIKYTENTKKHIKPILIIFFTSLVISIYVSIDTTMIGYIQNDAQVGYYSVAVKIYTALKTVFSAIISVLIPRMSILIASKNRANAKKLLAASLESFIVIILPLIAFITINSRLIIEILFGEMYSFSVLALQIISFGIIFAVFASVITNCIFLPMSLEKYSLIATTTSAIVNVLLNFPFIKKWGTYGAATTTVLSECLVFLISYVLLRKSKVDFLKLIKIRYLFLSILLCCVVVVSRLLVTALSHSNTINMTIQFIIILMTYGLVFKKQIIELLNRKRGIVKK